MKNYKAKIKLTITNHNHGFYGPGIYELMKLIDTEKSTKKAADKMGLSYSKALKILKRCEKELGDQIIISQRGGSNHGLTELTELGHMLILSYEKFLDSQNKSLDENFKKFFPYLN